MNARKLIAACKAEAGYPRHRWEVALHDEQTNENRPFRPENFDKWAGDIDLLSNYTKHIRPGIYLECWIHGPEELEDNVYIRVESETSASVRICGSKEWRTVVIGGAR